jgi:chromosome segregation protein
VRRQLRPLERQADAARRHGGLVAELRALHVFAAGRELTTLKRRLGDATAARAELRNEETLLKRSLTDLDVAVMAAESELATLGGSEVGDALARVQALREKARGQLALLAERRRGVDRERAAFVDQGVIASLEADAARLGDEIEALAGESESLAPDAEALARAEARLAEARAAFDAEWGEGVPAPSGRAAEVRGELGALRKVLDRAGADAQRAETRVDTLRAKLARLDAEAARASEQIGGRADEPALAAAVETAAARRAAAEAAARSAEQRRDDAQAERHAWAARVDALAMALDQARARAGAERLSGVEGVVGTLLELVEIDPGWEAAAEAACGEALAAVVVDSVDSGRRALRVLAEGDVPGAVLALGAAAAPRTPPPVGEPVLRHVHPRRADVGPLVEGLLGAAVAVDGGWTAAVDAALAHPDAVVVTRSGGRYGTHGWRVSTTTTGATGAALDEARTRSTGAAAAADEALAAHRTAQTALDQARKAEEAAARALEQHQRTLASASEARERAARERDDAQAELDLVAEQQRDVAERLARDRARHAELAAQLPQLEAAEAALRDQAAAMADARRRLDAQAGEVAARRTDLDKRRTALADRNAFLRRRRAEVEDRLAGSVAARKQAEERRVELDATERALDRLAGFVGDRLAVLEERLADMQARRARETEAQRTLSAQLDSQRRQRAASERSLAEKRERLQRIEIDEAEVRLRLEQAIEHCRTQLDVEPEAAVAAPRPELDEGMTPTVRIRELERELRVMGPVNPLALEEFDALSERHTFLTEQLDDVKASRRELNKVIRAIDEEIVRVFAAAFADVSENFEQLFATLFPGGVGRLRLTDPDDLLNTGIEIEAKPSGKNVKKLTLLSGGERSLTALAYLFAVFRSRPSPFYVMDEVEAALDDVNLHRFLDLVAEFREEAQLIVVSHQKRTMEAADCLYGVTMQPGGSSKVVSEKVAAGA